MKLNLGIRHKYRVAALFLLSLRSLLRSGRHGTVLILGSPFHSNLGDQAQTLATEEWARNAYPARRVSTLDTRSASMFGFLLLRLARRRIRADDLIVLHSGYHTTDLYPAELGLQKEAVLRFPDCQILVMPQTINFSDLRNLDSAASVFNAHRRVTFLCRDERSYSTALSNFGDCDIHLFPDIVTSKIGTLPFVSDRQGIQLCLRRDAESVYVSQDLAPALQEKLQAIATTTLTDTNSPLSAVTIRRRLRSVLSTSWTEFAQYRVTVTDRYHGVIFSLIAGTPVVVLSSADHKLESGVKWFPSNRFGSYVKFARSIEEAAHYAADFYRNTPGGPLDPYFQDEYFATLREKLTSRV